MRRGRPLAEWNIAAVDATGAQAVARPRGSGLSCLEMTEVRCVPVPGLCVSPLRGGQPGAGGAPSGEPWHSPRLSSRSIDKHRLPLTLGWLSVPCGLGERSASCPVPWDTRYCVR